MSVAIGSSDLNDALLKYLKYSHLCKMHGILLLSTIDYVEKTYGSELLARIPELDGSDLVFDKIYSHTLIETISKVTLLKFDECD